MYVYLLGVHVRAWCVCVCVSCECECVCVCVCVLCTCVCNTHTNTITQLTNTRIHDAARMHVGPYILHVVHLLVNRRRYNTFARARNF